MNVLALDLGSRIGWSAFHVNDQSYTDLGSGFFDTIMGKNSTERSKNIKILAEACDHTTRGYDPRPGNFYRLCKELKERFEPEIVAFEDVQFFNSLYQTQLWGSFRGVMWSAFGDFHTWRAYDVGDIKKFATGRGDAKKEHMLSSIHNLGFKTLDDNEADALWIGLIACERHLNPDAKEISAFVKK
jgi:Holliday junction resolvasome RuvABC endonuclease subunit